MIMNAVHLISGPRNISTALMYSFAQREDCFVVDEPFYGYYLKRTGADHPGRDEIIEAMETQPSEIIKILNLHEKEKFLFIKNMAHHLEGIPADFMFAFHNIFLIRNPGQILASYHQVRSHPTLDDIGIRQQAELMHELQCNQINFNVLDSGEVLKNPRKVLGELCHRIQIPFSERMLSWAAGPRNEDGIWAPYWYDHVHKSTGFSPQETSQRELPLHLLPVFAKALPYYQKLHHYSIKA